MNNEPEGIREQLRLIAQALIQISDKPETLSDMIDSIKSLNQKQFEAALEKANLPLGVECITIVETITRVIYSKEIKYEKVCSWKQGGVLTTQFKEQAANSLDANTTAQLQAVLEAAGVLKCDYVPTIQNGSVITATIARSICPGSPKPG
jgi:hypothetical protein